MTNSLLSEKNQSRLLILGAFCLPIKLSFAYIVFIPLILLRFLSWYRNGSEMVGSAMPIVAPLMLYFIVIGLCAPFGINPTKSLPNIGAALFMVLLIPAFASLGNEETKVNVLVGLIAGQTLAACDTILRQLNFGIEKRFFVGEVTESGQLALVIPIVFGLLRYLSSHKKNSDTQHPLFSSEIRQEIVALFLTILLLINCATQSLSTLPNIQSMLLTITTVTYLALAYALSRFRKTTNDTYQLLSTSLMLISLPLLLAAIIVNLKRGPWAGALIGLTLYFLLYRPRTIIPTLMIALFAVFTIAPVRERIISARDHFYISGGRSEIWDIGAELFTTYPLGIGFRNSSVLGKFSTDIPDNLRHFHSNPINIAAENGALGLVLFYWWIFCCLKEAFRLRKNNDPNHPIAIGIACSIISWQTAGLVEFNVGDSEVLFIAYILIGVLGYIATKNRSAQKPGQVFQYQETARAI